MEILSITRTKTSDSFLGGKEEILKVPRNDKGYWIMKIVTYKNLDTQKYHYRISIRDDICEGCGQRNWRDSHTFISSISRTKKTLINEYLQKL